MAYERITREQTISLVWSAGETIVLIFFSLAHEHVVLAG